MCTGLSFMLCKIADLLSYVVPVLATLGVVYFVWGVVQYVIGGDEEAKTKGRDRIIFGLIGLAVIVSLWGLVRLIQDTFQVSNFGNNPTQNELQNLLPSRPSSN